MSTEQAVTHPPPEQPRLVASEPYRYTAGDRVRGFIWGITEPFRVDKTPAWASLLALLIAVAPGFSQWLEKGGWGEYDPTIAVLTATLIALIWTAHYTFRAVRHAREAEDRKQTRRRFARLSMAAGVISELEYLKLSLAVMHARIVLHGVHFLERPQLRNALAHVDLFSAPAASDLSEFDSLLRQIESHTALYMADHAVAVQQADRAEHRSKMAFGFQPGGFLNFDPSRVADIRKMIDGAQNLMPLVKQRLLGEC